MKEFKGVIQQAIREINQQRRELEVLRAIRDTVYAFKGAIEAPGRSEYGMSEDIAWRLGEVVKEIDKRESDKKPEPNPINT